MPEDNNDSTRKIVDKQLEDLMGEPEDTYIPRYRPYVRDDLYDEDTGELEGPSYFKQPVPSTPWWKKDEQVVPAYRKAQALRQQTDKQKAEKIVADLLKNRGYAKTVVRQTPVWVMEEVLNILLDYME